MKQARHTRRIRTRRGMKTIVVNPNIRKRIPMRTHANRPWPVDLTHEEREQSKQLKHSIEIGRQRKLEGSDVEDEYIAEKEKKLNKLWDSIEAREHKAYGKATRHRVKGEWLMPKPRREKVYYGEPKKVGEAGYGAYYGEDEDDYATRMRRNTKPICPGGKIRSEGRGRGLGLGQGKGPRNLRMGEWERRKKIQKISRKLPATYKSKNN